MKWSSESSKATLGRTGVFLGGILGLQFGVGAFAVAERWLYFPDGDVPISAGAVNVIYWIGIVGLLYGWCRADAKCRQLAIPAIEFLLVPLLFPVGIPYYYLHTYPLRAALLHIGGAAVFVLSCVAAFWLGLTLPRSYIHQEFII
jgi:hypothetical protein